ncbi:DUF5635 domain-containing protein [Corynebacterium uropygiale]|uniref:DUF5635 domain-containing protein n=1 Tax=Corynebacterium uropygiale TaxID=1775911 RepID=A0A9X1QPS8_9CORY|nr:DUF5635 domain-containing protein [Corynebacterium uropygiale]MCF4005603.1 DUF5635 domain-containing protein [Corynebacterium uropygiale]
MMTRPPSHPPHRPRSPRAAFEPDVHRILGSAQDGFLREHVETQWIEFKEEAGRRSGPIIEPGHRENPTAAKKLAHAVACMANSVDGGALIVGVEDKEGQVIGTMLDAAWLQQRIDALVGIAPEVCPYEVEGQRVLTLYVPPAPEPIEDTKGRLRWRVGDSCQPVTRAQWWERRRDRPGCDPLALPSPARLADVRPDALAFARACVRKSAGKKAAAAPAPVFLDSLGALTSSGHLTEAAALLFTRSPRPGFAYVRVGARGEGFDDAHPSPPTPPPAPEQDISVLEQLQRMEASLSATMPSTTLTLGEVPQHIPALPRRATREALMNALIHRDWARPEPVEVRWDPADSRLEVRSPGGFVPGMSAERVLSRHASASPALADLCRALRLTGPHGMGVPRMCQAMLSLGHPLPTVREVHDAAGPAVLTTLAGGPPHRPMLELQRRLVPAARRTDYRVAVLLSELLRHGVLTQRLLAERLCTTREAARVALETAAQTMVAGQALIIPLPIDDDAASRTPWILGPTARRILAGRADTRRSAHAQKEEEQARLRSGLDVWLREFPTLSATQLMQIADVPRATAQRFLDELVEDGTLELDGRGGVRREHAKKRGET